MLQLLLSTAIFRLVASQNCSDFSNCKECTDADTCRWCLSLTSCVSSMYSCHPKNTVDDAYNCPTLVYPLYNDTFVRKEILYFIAAANAVNNSHQDNHRAPWQCVSKLSSDISIDYTLEVPCYGGSDRCALLVAVHQDRKSIVVSFRTSTSYSSLQFLHQFLHFVLSKVTRIADTDSYIVKYYYVTFWELFNGGLGGKLEELLAKYPRYDFLLVGHSLGGAHATIAAYYFQRFYPDRKISIYTFSSPRVGDAKFVSSIERVQGVEFFRIVRNGDWIPDLPFRISEKARLTHTRYEALYSTTGPGDEPRICLQAEDNTCSRGTWLKDPFTHIRIFQNLHTWYEDGCTKDTGI